MRIIAGKYRSRNLKTLKSNATRPTLDKVKEAVFSKLGTYFDGGVCLDLFSGSGAIGLEALSRGMYKAILVDKSYEAINIIKENVKALEADASVFKMDYKAALNKFQNEQFDLIYIDPPYHLHVYNDILKFIDEHQMLKEYGYIVCESLNEEEINKEYQELVFEKEVSYGIMKVIYIRRKK